MVQCRGRLGSHWQLPSLLATAVLPDYIEDEDEPADASELQFLSLKQFVNLFSDPSERENICQAVHNVMPLLDERLRSYKLSRKPIPSTTIEIKELD